MTLLGQGRSGVTSINYTVGVVVSGFELRVSVVPRRKLGTSRLLYGLGQPLPSLVLFSDWENACVLELLLVQVRARVVCGGLGLSLLGLPGPIPPVVC